MTVGGMFAGGDGESAITDLLYFGLQFSDLTFKSRNICRVIRLFASRIQELLEPLNLVFRGFNLLLLLLIECH